MILKKQLKKLKKSKTLENIYLESLKSVDVSRNEISNKIHSEKEFECSPLERCSKEHDAKIKILQSKIIPLVPEYLKDVFQEMFFERKLSFESSEAAMQTDAGFFDEAESQTQDVEKADAETESEPVKMTDSHIQTDDAVPMECAAQTDEIVVKDTSTGTEDNLRRQSEVDRSSQTESAEINNSDAQTEISNETKDEINQTEPIFDVESDEKKLESLTKCLEIHSNLLKECADFSKQINKDITSCETSVQTESLEKINNAKSGGSFVTETKDIECKDTQTDPIWLPKSRNESHIRQIQCGLTSFISHRNLFSPMATLLTPLGRS